MSPKPDPTPDLIPDRLGPTATPPLPEGETLLALFRADRGQYWRDHAMLAALAMALGMGVLWAMGNPHVWTGAVGGLAAIGLRGAFLASEELGHEWRLTDARLLGPMGRDILLGNIAETRILGTSVQVITRLGDKHQIKFLADRETVRRQIDAARTRA